MTLLEANLAWQPINYAIGIAVFALLVLLLLILRGIGASRPHS